MRPDWNTYMMRKAYLAATRATCDRKHVGAVIVTPDWRVAAEGYNGAPSGMPSCDEEGHELVQTGLGEDGQPKMSCIRTLHAESNALDFAGRSAQGCTLFTTVTPCYDCAKRIVNAGIAKVVYDEFYGSRYGRSTTVPEYLESAGLEVVQFESAGLTLFKNKLREMERVELEMLQTTLVEFQCGCQLTADKAKDRCEEHHAPRLHD